MLLGVRAVIAESFERIHRSNLIGMGILPLEYGAGQTRETLGLTGEETFAISGIAAEVRPRMRVHVTATSAAGATIAFDATVRIDTPDEADYYRHGGILQFVLRQIAHA
jgi:aconitate hydratase